MGNFFFQRARVQNHGHGVGCRLVQALGVTLFAGLPAARFGVLYRTMHAALCKALYTALFMALLLAPALGQIHRTLHSGGNVAHMQEAAEPAGFSLSALFSGHEATDCQLLDQLTLADAPQPAALGLAHALPCVPPPAGTQAPPKLRRQTAFHARAPPPQCV